MKDELLSLSEFETMLISAYELKKLPPPVIRNDINIIVDNPEKQLMDFKATTGKILGLFTRKSEKTTESEEDVDLGESFTVQEDFEDTRIQKLGATLLRFFERWS
jgi:hypothetical protein